MGAPTAPAALPQTQNGKYNWWFPQIGVPKIIQTGKKQLMLVKQ
jgi:hypothetical protein